MPFVLEAKQNVEPGFRHRNIYFFEFIIHLRTTNNLHCSSLYRGYIEERFDISVKKITLYFLWIQPIQLSSRGLFQEACKRCGHGTGRTRVSGTEKRISA